MRSGCLIRSLLITLGIVALHQVAHPSCVQTAKTAPPKPELVLQVGHDSTPQSFAFSPDGSYLVSGGGDSTVKLWDLRKGELLRSYAVDGSWTISTAFSADSKTFAAFTRFGKANLYDVASGKHLRVLDSGTEPAGIAFSPDGHTVALGGHSSSFSLWNYRTGVKLRSIRVHADDLSSVNQFAFSANGKSIASSGKVGFSTPKVEIWAVESGELIGSIETKGDVASMAFSPDGKSIAIGAGLWIGQTPTVELWDIENRKQVSAFAGHKFDIASLVFSRDGTTLSSGDMEGIFKLWEVKSGRLLQTVGSKEFHIPVAISPNGKLGAAPGRDGSIRVYDLQIGKLHTLLQGNPIQTKVIAAPGAGSVLITAGSMPVTSQKDFDRADLVSVWNPNSGTLIRQTVSHYTDISLLVVNRNGSMALTSGNYGEVQVWDLKKFTVRTILADRNVDIVRMVLSPDESTIAIGGVRKAKSVGENSATEQSRGPQRDKDPGMVELYSVRTGRLIRVLGKPKELVAAIGYSANGKSLMSVSYPGTATLWNVETGKPRSQFELGKHHDPYDAALSPDGRIVAVGFASDEIVIYSAVTGKALHTLQLPKPNYSGVSLLIQNNRLEVKTGDGNLYIWEVASGKLLRATGVNSGYLGAIGALHGGKTTATLADHSAINLWNTKTGTLRATLRLLQPTGIESSAPYWLANTPSGWYVGSEGVEEFLRWRGGNKLVTQSALPEKLKRPHRVQAALSDSSSRKTSLAGPRGLSVGAGQAMVKKQLQKIARAAEAEERPRAKPVTPTDKLKEALSTTYLLGDPEVGKRVAAAIRTQIEAGADKNAQGHYGTSALMLFSNGGNVKEIRHLLDLKVNPNLIDVYGGTALTHAARTGRDDVIQLLLDAGADIKDRDGRSLLPLKGDRAGLGKALLRTLTPNGQSQESPLENFQTFEIAYLLLFLGADPNVRDEKGRTPLVLLSYFTTANGSLLKSLLAHGADPNIADMDGHTILQRAAMNGDLETVRMLIQHGAKVDAADRGGMNPLIWSASRSNSAVGGLLLENGADPNAASIRDDGRTALMFAAASGYLELARVLLKHAAKVNQTNGSDNWTALTYAVSSQDPTMVKLLLENGADVQVRTKDGKSLLQVLKERDKSDSFGVGAALIKAGAK